MRRGESGATPGGSNSPSIGHQFDQLISPPPTGVFRNLSRCSVGQEYPTPPAPHGERHNDRSPAVALAEAVMRACVCAGRQVGKAGCIDLSVGRLVGWFVGWFVGISAAWLCVCVFETTHHSGLCYFVATPLLSRPPTRPNACFCCPRSVYDTPDLTFRPVGGATLATFGDGSAHTEAGDLPSDRPAISPD